MSLALILGGTVSAIVSCSDKLRPISNTLHMLWIMGSAALVILGLGIWATERPVQPPPRTSFIAPIAGAPLVRIEEAHSAFGGRRLPLASLDEVLP